MVAELHIQKMAESVPEEFLEGRIVLYFIKDVPIIVIRKRLICSLKSSNIKLTPRRIRQ